VWRGIQRRRAQRARKRLPLRRSVPLVAAAAVCAVILFVARRRGGPPHATGPINGSLRLAGGGDVVAVVASEGTGRAVAFSEGSRVELGPGSRLDPVENSATAFGVRVITGRATFDVHPGGPRRWSIECGPVRVAVVGTRFGVECALGRARVEVEHGVVRVSGERVREGEQTLSAGMSLEVEDSEEPQAPPPLPIVVPALRPPLPPPRSTSTAPPLPVPWRSLAEQGDNASAFEQLGSQGIARASENASVNDLLKLADVARLSGHPGDAVAPLSRVVTDFPQDPNAPLAAFTLGRLQLDVFAQPGTAADTFQRAIGLGLPQSLEADAYARLVEARTRAGDAAGAQAARQDYERRFPGGQRLDEVRKRSRGD
jgi:transmembrane sensor